MSLFRQGKEAEARQLALATAAKVKPLPKDEQNPLANQATHDDLILCLAYKEAKALIKFDEVLPPKGQKDKKEADRWGNGAYPLDRWRTGKGNAMPEDLTHTVGPFGAALLRAERRPRTPAGPPAPARPDR